jgi:hypothetical protein
MPLNNAAAPSFPIDLDRPRSLRFDFNALAAYEEATGESVMASSFAIDSARKIRALLWAGLLHEDATLTVQDVGAMIHTGNAMLVSQAVRGALASALPENADGDDDEEEGQAVGNGPAANPGPGGPTG